ncbi:hypothetical protein JMJ35_002670 [Cladonia borealis]|uniref:F-box domain-containing protein n=1 Tax=Cladonia borealis TaxID=184061 RepID=A0AA39UD98_9LECA|nr:hypothetical protein JMJ35_002670 [Cladonia borealis]
MPTMMGLPNEILISIIDATGPEDVVSFSTCCKLMYDLARDRLEEHKEKKRLLSKIFVNGDFLPFLLPFRDTNGNKDTDLKEFFSDKRNRSYPKAMDVTFNLEESGPLYEDKFERQLESAMAAVHSMIALVGGEIVATEWGKDVKAGYPLAVFLWFLALLPNLEECEIRIFGYYHQTLSANYSKIIRLMIEAALEQEENRLSYGGRLTKCTVDADFDRNGSIGESFLPFIMMLPKIRIIQGCCLDIEHLSWPFTDAVSPLVDLDLNGGINTATLSNYVRGIRELKSFRYNFEDDFFVDHLDIDWEPCEIVSTLRQSAFRTLVSLDLTINLSRDLTWFDISPGIGSLRSFEVLETIHLHYILLLEEVLIAHSADEVDSAETSEILDEESLTKRQRLIDFLPSSVKTFQLEDIAIAEGEGVLDIFEGFPEHRVERLPNLELISLDTFYKTISQVREICERAGVRINQAY